MKNELAVVGEIEKRLQQRREPAIFPLTPTHRRELRDLRDSNIGSLRHRLSTLKGLKKEEYLKKYLKQISTKLDEHNTNCSLLNSDWAMILKKISTLIENRKVYEKRLKPELADCASGYGDICNLKFNELDCKRNIHIRTDVVSREILDEQFDLKYGKAFDIVDKKIDDLTTKYEEAINFGDLEIVKELYYIMKNSDEFFIKLSKLKI